VKFDKRELAAVKQILLVRIAPIERTSASTRETTILHGVGVLLICKGLSF
jgi:hypothetical protein